ncbi:MAG: carboxylesterase/lipase family protein [Acidimicrobiales bacterium]
MVTSNGPVRGKPTPEGDVLLFRGIPYAAPTGGASRWRPPGPPERWDEVLDATRFGPAAPQNPSALETARGATRTVAGEDCLRVNVWTPAADDRRRPVLVWIHGGGFTGGSGATPWYDGRRFCRRGDVVVVSLNYRLGVLGFLDLSALGDAGLDHAGTAGLLDQIAALAWVRDNIAAFGGDPTNVTVFGESAGAMSIGTLLAMPAASGLFHKAILQSGAAQNTSSPERARMIAAEVLGAAGLRSVDALRDVPVEVLLAAQAEVERRHQGGGLPFQPVWGGPDLPAPPLEAVTAGAAAGIPLLVGTTLEEMRLFGIWDDNLASLDDDGIVARWRGAVGEQTAKIVAAYRAERPDASAADLWTAVATDWVFRMPAIRLLEAQLTHQPSCWSYLFTMRSTAFGGMLGACHALEIPFVFDTLDRPGVAMFTGDPEGAAELAVAMQEAWIAFARDGAPASPGLPPWPAYDSQTRATMELGPQRRVIADPYDRERRLWDEVA